RLLVPAVFADQALREGLVASGNLGKTVLAVLRPVHVRGQLGQAAEALLAFAHHIFGLFALDELANLAADDADRSQQAFIGVAYLAAVEREHADHFSLGHDRKKKSTVHAGI